MTRIDAGVPPRAAASSDLVADQEQHVAGGQIQLPFVVRRPGVQAERPAGWAATGSIAPVAD
jgi:hypothetical protein